MNKFFLIIILTSLLMLVTGCSSGGGTSPSAAAASPTAPLPTPAPLPVIPSPTPTPAPPPPVASYTCANHPLTNGAFVGVIYNITFHADCTYTFTDAAHIAYGSWAPNPDPAAAVIGDNTATYPLSLTPNGSYVCLPANGPQNCPNNGYAGNVLITVSTQNIGAGLIITSN